METNDIYQLAINDDIFITNMPMANGLKAFSVMFANGECAIAIDYANINNSADERVIITHEIGHCETGTFYTQYSCLNIRSRCEYRADKWAIKKLIPKNEMVSAMKKGYYEIWQLAEYFNVTEEFIKKAFWIYFDKTV